MTNGVIISDNVRDDYCFRPYERREFPTTEEQTEEQQEGLSPLTILIIIAILFMVFK